MAQEPEGKHRASSRNSEDWDDMERQRPTRIGRQPAVRRPQNRRTGRFQPRRKVCLFCANKDRQIDWKDIDTLRRFTGDNGQIFPRRKSGLCAKHQRHIAKAIKQARHIALLPYTSEHVRVMGKR